MEGHVKHGRVGLARRSAGARTSQAAFASSSAADMRTDARSMTGSEKVGVTMKLVVEEERAASIGASGVSGSRQMREGGRKMSWKIGVLLASFGVRSQIFDLVMTSGRNFPELPAQPTAARPLSRPPPLSRSTLA